MKASGWRGFVLVTLMLALGGKAMAAPLGSGFTFQGQLQEGSAASTATSCDLQFRLFDAGTGGVQIGATQTLSAVALSQGVFAVELNGGGEFGTAAFDGSDRWLDIAVRCPAGTGSWSAPFAPRQKLTSAPNALWARAAGDLACVGCVGSNDLAAGAVGTTQIGDSQITGAKLANGTVSSTKLASGAVGSTQLATGAVGSAQLADGSVQTIDLANAAVTTAKIAPGANGQVLTTTGGSVAWQAPAAGGGSAWSLGGNAGTDPETDYVGTSDDKPLELRVAAQRALRLEPPPADNEAAGFRAANNVILGSAFNRVGEGVANASIGGGGIPLDADLDADFANRVFADGGTVSGGSANAAFGPHSTVGGGTGNSSFAALSTIGGGNGHTINGIGGTIGGGDQNSADGEIATVAGGSLNRAAGAGGVIGGGSENSVSSISVFATVAGGLLNTAEGDSAAIGGGTANIVAGEAGTVAGGLGNEAQGAGSSVGGGTENVALSDGSTVGGGEGNSANADYATVGGGSGNTAFGSNATVAGGTSNTASGEGSTVGGGQGNDASGISATIAGGDFGIASGDSATIAGGDSNEASGEAAAVGGGSTNTASGAYATVAGGSDNTASGDYSAAGGRKAQAEHTGAFVWADSEDATFPSAGPDTFNIRAAGGIRLARQAGGGTTITTGGQLFRDNVLVAWGRVSATGTIRESFGVASVTRIVPGAYTVTTHLEAASGDSLVPVVVPVVTTPPTDAASARLVFVRVVTQNQFVVHVTDGNWTAVDGEFSFTVTGRDSAGS